MIDLIVARGAGDLSGPDIIDGLLSSHEIALLRGQTEINDHEPIIRVQLTTVFRAGVRCGQLIEVLDAAQGEVWRGKIVGITHYSKNGGIWSDLDVERPA